TDGFRPRLARRVNIELDRQGAQKTGQMLSPGRIETAAPLRYKQAIEGFERPQHRRPGARLADFLQQGRRCCGALVFKAPGQRHGIVEHETHDRPSLIRSLILRPPSVTPRLASSRPATARRAISRSKLGPAGTSLATGLPRRVMMISSPCSTRSSRAPS